MAISGGDATYKVKYNKSEGFWMVKGPGFFSGGRHATKKQAVKGARTMANDGDTLKVYNKDGSLNRKITIGS